MRGLAYRLAQVAAGCPRCAGQWTGIVLQPRAKIAVPRQRRQRSAYFSQEQERGALPPHAKIAVLREGCYREYLRVASLSNEKSKFSFRLAPGSRGGLRTAYRGSV